jgi:hypothetical protein
MGEIKGPLHLTEMAGDSIISERWEEGFTGKKWINTSPGNYSEIKIDPLHQMPELFRLNNNIRTSGICRRSDPFEVRLIYALEDLEKKPLIIIPAFDWNSTDGLMAGLAFHNGRIMPKSIQYIGIPLYSFKNPGLSGYGKISFNMIPYDNIIRLATVTLEGTKIGTPGNYNFSKAKIGLDLNLKPGRAINPVYQKIFSYYITASDLNRIELTEKTEMRSYLVAGYLLERNGIINPFNLLLSSETGKLYNKTSLELNYKYSYYGKSNGLEIRLFAGTMLKNDPADPFFAFAPSGRSGTEQYLYPGIYPDRFGEFPLTFWSRQTGLSEGGLVSPVNDSLGYSRSVCSITLSSSLPWKASRIPVKPFFTLLLNDPENNNSGNSFLFFEAGLKAGIWKFFEIYFPLMVSDNIDGISGTVKSRIRFVFSLDIFNALKF